jgi:hypothetical protein
MWSFLFRANIGGRLAGGATGRVMEGDEGRGRWCARASLVSRVFSRPVDRWLRSFSVHPSRYHGFQLLAHPPTPLGLSRGPGRSSWATRGLVAFRGPERSDRGWKGCFVEITLEKRRRGLWICEMCHDFDGTCVLCVSCVSLFWYYDNARVFVMRIDIARQ